MKKIVIIASVALVLLILCLLLFSFPSLFRTFEFDGSTIVYGEDTYVPSGSPQHVKASRTLAHSDGWEWTVSSVKDDPSGNFILLTSFLESRLYVREDYEIPENGEITKAYWNMKNITDTEFLRVIECLISERKTDHSFETDAIFALTETQKMRELSVAYEGCPVTTEYIGYMGVVNGKWVITTDSAISGTVDCCLIPEEYLEILEKYFD